MFEPELLAGTFVQFFPELFVLPLQPWIGLAGGVGLLALELLITLPAVEIERALVERRLHRATGLAAMRAIAKPALRSQRGDIGERRLERGGIDIPELQFAHAWRVDHQHARLCHNELAAGRSVPALDEGSLDF